MIIYVILAAFFLALNGLSIFEKNSFMRVLPNIVLILAVFKYAFFKKGHLYIGKKPTSHDLWAYLILLAFFLISVVRTNKPTATITGVANDAVMIVMINTLIYLGAAYFFRNSTNFALTASRITAGAMIGPSVLIMFMLTLFIVAYKSGTFIEGEARSRAVILGVFGIVAEKRNIPYVDLHPNYIGIFAGAIFVMSVFSLRLTNLDRKARKLIYLNIIVCLFFMVLADSRVTFMNSFLTIGVIYLLSKINGLRLLKILIPLMPILPLMMLLALSFLAKFDTVQSMTRNPEDLTTGNYRSYIWAHCYNDLLQPRPAHIYGFGEHGQMASGVSSKYAYIFMRLDNAELAVTHNAFLQSFFDVGYLGLAAFLLVLLLTISRAIKLYSEGQKIGLVYLGFFVYFIISGTTESNFGYYNRTYFIVFMIITMSLFVIYSEFQRLKTDGTK